MFLLRATTTTTTAAGVVLRSNRSHALALHHLTHPLQRTLNKAFASSFYFASSSSSQDDGGNFPISSKRQTRTYHSNQSQQPQQNSKYDRNQSSAYKKSSKPINKSQQQQSNEDRVSSTIDTDTPRKKRNDNQQSSHNNQRNRIEQENQQAQQKDSQKKQSKFTSSAAAAQAKEDPKRKQSKKQQQYMHLLSSVKDKEILLESIEEDPRVLVTLLTELSGLAKSSEASNSFEAKYFRSYVYIIDQFLRSNRGELSKDLHTSIEIASRMSYIYAHLGRLSFQKQLILARKVVQTSIENVRELTLSDLNMLLYTIATFEIQNTHEADLYYRFRDLLKEGIDLNRETLDTLVDIHFNISKIAVKRKGSRNSKYIQEHNNNDDAQNALLVLLDLLNSAFYEAKSELTFGNASKIVSSLSLARVKVNREFLIVIAEVLRVSLPQGRSEKKGTAQQHLQAFVAVTALEDSLTTGLSYVYEIDAYYEKVLHMIDASIDQFSPSLLGTVASALQRISYYEPNLLFRIAAAIMQFDFYGFQVNILHYYSTEFIGGKLETDESVEKKKRLAEIKEELRRLPQQITSTASEGDAKYVNKKGQNVIDEKRAALLSEQKQVGSELTAISKMIVRDHNNLNALFKVVHCLGQYNLRNNINAAATSGSGDKNSGSNEKQVDGFLSYFYEVIALYALKFKTDATLAAHFDAKYVTRCIWALCVLDSPARIAQTLHTLIHTFLFSSENAAYQLNRSDVSVLFYTHLYLQKHAQIFPNALIESIHANYSQQILKTKKNVSLFCLDVQKHLQELKIPSRLEMKVDNILVDIQIPSTLYGKQIIIDVHGYQHYFRNVEILKGNSMIKKKIIEAYYDYMYVVVPIFEWQLLAQQHKHEYLINMLQTIKLTIENQSQENNKEALNEE